MDRHHRIYTGQNRTTAKLSMGHHTSTTSTNRALCRERKVSSPRGEAGGCNQNRFVHFEQTEVLRHLAAVDTEYLPGDEGGFV